MDIVRATNELMCSPEKYKGIRRPSDKNIYFSISHDKKYSRENYQMHVGNRVFPNGPILLVDIIATDWELLLSQKETDRINSVPKGKDCSSPQSSHSCAYLKVGEWGDANIRCKKYKVKLESHINAGIDNSYRWIYKCEACKKARKK